MSHHSFSKKEHLVSLQDINALFSQKSGAINGYPVRLIYRVAGNNTLPALVLISVSKRHFKHAVDRNRAKRQIRESYRLNKDIIWEPLAVKKQQVHIAFLWLSDTPVASREINLCIRKLLSALTARI